MHKKLFIPGPIDCRPEVLEKLSAPMIGHRTKECTEIGQRIQANMQKMWKTKNVVVISTTSGSGLMEAAIKCCTAKRAACFSVGSFGDRWHKMATTNGVEADIFRSEEGKCTTPEMVEEALATGKYDLITVTHNETSSGVMNPVGEIAKVVAKYPEVVFCVDSVSSAGGADIPVDEWGIDICITSTQKCLGVPPGLSLASVSEKAYNRAKTVPNRGLYLDIVSIYDMMAEKAQYPSTPALSLMYALDWQLDQIVNVEGIENRYARHIEMAQYIRAWAKKHFDLVADEAHLSNTLTVIKKPENVNISDLNKKLAELGLTIAPGYGKLKESSFRISHMGDYTMEDMKLVTSAIEKVLGL
ncbi:MAG: alanine--glyoxylate aminotransferase family protein [Clostridia bacterium]|nr:alanine--glyoxylate aminotransferase family protein [Clostridia bacterium]